MSQYRRTQLTSILLDGVSALLVWIAFLVFRWLVYEGKIFSMATIVIPLFDFVPPLILFPLACVVIHYLTGYYLRPLQRKYSQLIRLTFVSSCIITITSFFAIVINDQVEDYTVYITSLVIFFLLQFCISLITRTIYYYSHDVSRHQKEELFIPYEAGESEEVLFQRIKQAYPSGKPILLKPRTFDLLTGAARIRDINEEAYVCITDQHMSDASLCQKRAFDIAASLLFMVIMSPLYIVIAILVKRSSPGPIIYRQERIGIYGLPFQILKFRTMIHNAENDIPQLSSDHDPRITPLGHFLRKYRLDEIPQMWNVLRGEMSIVGPRPERAYFIELIEQKAPYYCLLYKIKPGLTSWGPIKVGYTDTLDKMILRLNYDITYMENMSLLLDLKILVNTLSILFNGKGK